MTAEVAILNRRAVALAADSAVTIDYPGIPKIYFTANKLFMLSQYHPVGIMFYGAADFMGIPWETIVKMYRRRIKSKKFDTLEEYAQGFLAFLESADNDLYTEEQQGRYFETIISWVSYQVRHKLDVSNRPESEIDMEEVDAAVAEISGEFAQVDDLPSLPSDYGEKVIARYKPIIERFIENYFKALPLSNGTREALVEICYYLATKSVFPNSCAGVVIAGFGDRETFPTVVCHDLEAVILNRLKYRHRKEKSIRIGPDTVSAAIVPFAQEQVVKAFIEGIDPDYEQLLLSYLRHLFDEYPEILLDRIPHISDDDKLDLLENLKAAGSKLVEVFAKEMAEVRNKRYVDPIMYNVSNLPLEELATMAETLVNITAFKRKVSIESETVGEPIDVAVISKKDGFIWIKRKHYFDPQFNQHFFANYFRDYGDREVSDDE